MCVLEHNEESTNEHNPPSLPRPPLPITHCLIHSTYSVCKVNSVTPEVTFKRIIEQYKQLAGAGSGGALSAVVGTTRLSVIKDILLSKGDGVAAAGAAGATPTDKGAGDGGGNSNSNSGGSDGSGGEAGGRGGGREPEQRGDIIKFYNKVRFFMCFSSICVFLCVCVRNEVLRSS